MNKKVFSTVFILTFISLTASTSYGQSAQPAYRLTKIMGGTSDDSASGIAADSSGNIYVAGYFQGTVNFGLDFGTTDNKTSAGSDDVYITKINSNGAYGWTRIIGGTASDRGYAITTDPSGNVYVAGDFQGTVNFGLDFGATDIKTAAGFGDIFFTKLYANGTYGWTKTIGGSSPEECLGIAVDASGNIYLTGDFWGVVDFGQNFGTTDIQTSAGEQDIFITKINANLTYGWTRTSGLLDSDYGNAVAVDPSGNVYMAGNRDWTSGAGGFPIVIIKINGNGTVGWTKNIYAFAAMEGGAGRAVATNSSGNVFITGVFNGTVDFGAPFGTTDIKISMSGDIFVLKINSNGTYGWTKRIGGTGNDIGSGITMDSLGNIYVTGYFQGMVNFGLDFGGTDNKTSAGWGDIFVTKIGSDGSYGWTRIMGGASDDLGYGITTGSSASVCVAGNFQGTVNFGLDFGTTDNKTSAGGSDVFMTRLALYEFDITIPRHAVGDFDGDGNDEIAVDFGAAGIWKYDSGAWTQLAPENPESLLAGDVDGDSADDILADLVTAGLWLWNGGTWSRLSGVNVESMAVGDVDADGAAEVIGSFGAAGLWLYNGGAWTQLSGVSADLVMTANVDGTGGDEIVGDFGPAGLWIWKAGVWAQLSGVNADHVTAGKMIGGRYLLCDFGDVGLWAWTELGGWTHLSGANADYMITADTDGEHPDEIFGDFGSLGLWLWKNGAWSQLSGLDAVYMIRADVNGDGKDEVAVDFGSVGLWLWNNGAWSQLSRAISEYLVAGDLDGDNKDEILSDFGALGLWMWNEGTWSQISSSNPD
jgi:hypothetical protein